MHRGLDGRRTEFTRARCALAGKGVFRCADGHISVMFSGGAAASSAKAMVDWIDEKGFAADWMKQQNWRVWLPGVLSDASEEELRQVADVEWRRPC